MADDIILLAQRSDQAAEQFFEKSLFARLKYQYAGQFLGDGHKNELLALAKSSEDSLRKVLKEQQQLRADIEAYDGDDWDELFGDTKLWQKIYGDEVRTIGSKMQITYYIALAGNKTGRLEAAKEIITWCDLQQNQLRSPQTELLKAKAMSVACSDDKEYVKYALEVLDELIGSVQDLKVYCEAAILRAELLEDMNEQLLMKLSGRIKESEYKDDFELNARLAFTGLSLSNTKLLEEVIAVWPESEKLVAGCILSEMDHLRGENSLTDEYLSAKSAYEIQLALKAVLGDSPYDHRELMERFNSIEKFKSAVLYYALGESYLKDEPVLAVEFYISAAGASDKGDETEINTVDLAEKAALLAVELYNGDKNYCDIANTALLSYCQAAGMDAKEYLAELYFKILDDCNSQEQAAEKLRDASESSGYFAETVHLELMKREIARDPTGQNYLNIINLLDKSDDLCRRGGFAVFFLEAVISRVEEYLRTEADFADECYTLACRLSDCDDKDFALEVDLLKIEYGIIAGKDIEQLGDALEEINGESMQKLRCTARLLQAKGEYAESARTWEKIYTFLQQNEDPGACHARWQAKYYQLLCVSELGDMEKQDIIHAVEILQSSYDDIPPFWAEKLNELKE
ncbi:MAG: hypothetical protein JW912_07040 [Sedimentisphaerales bacterium]|nr:hypothetical protein [Sedimentisphaerales bacterium]